MNTGEQVVEKEVRVEVGLKIIKGFSHPLEKETHPHIPSSLYK